jgi:hypothetical protein
MATALHAPDVSPAQAAVVPVAVVALERAAAIQPEADSRLEEMLLATNHSARETPGTTLWARPTPVDQPALESPVVQQARALAALLGDDFTEQTVRALMIAAKSDSELHVLTALLDELQPPASLHA